MNCCFVDAAIVALAGVIAMETSFGAMVNFTEPLTEFMLAVMETAPLDCAVSIPPVATVASPAGDVAQVTDPVRSLVVLSLYVPVAVNGSVSLTTRSVLGAATWMDTNVAGVITVFDPLPTQPSIASSELSTMVDSALRVEVIGREVFIAPIAGARGQPKQYA
jgi:hypothetical protein